MKSIYTTAVAVTSQEQAYRLREVCINEGLAISSGISFKYKDSVQLFLRYSNNCYYFDLWYVCPYYELITEAEFMELLKTTK